MTCTVCSLGNAAGRLRVQTVSGRDELSGVVFGAVSLIGGSRSRRRKATAERLSQMLWLCLAGTYVDGARLFPHEVHETD